MDRAAGSATDMRRIVAARHEGTKARRHEVKTVGVRLWPGCLLAVIGVALYAHTLDAPFIFDDTVAIVDNDSIKGLSPEPLSSAQRRDSSCCMQARRSVA